MSEFLTKKEFETWKRNLEKRSNLDVVKEEVNTAVSARFQNSDDYVQRGRVNAAYAGTAVSFAEAYDVAPNVVISCESRDWLATAGSITVNGFTAYVHAVGTKYCNWIAIGRKA